MFRDGRVKEFSFLIRTTPWGSIKSPSDYEAPDLSQLNSQMLALEPATLKVKTLPTLPTFDKKKV